MTWGHLDFPGLDFAFRPLNKKVMFACQDGTH